MNMMRKVLLAATALLIGASTPDDGSNGPYLRPERMPDGVAILPPPPVPGGPQAVADRAIFAATRRLAGTPRWAVATDDVTNAPLPRYACAMGLALDATRAPALARLLDRSDSGGLVERVKSAYHVQRPYIGTDAPVCEPRTAHLAANGDFPSGHTANGWVEAQILAELIPARAGEILARGRAYGESRAVCGSHTLSAVEAGWLAGSSVFVMLHATPAFRRDLAAARAELARIAATAPRPDPERCAAEAQALAIRPW